MSGLDGQICLVLGAAGGIGSAVVRSFVQQGATVVAVDVDAGRLDTLKADIPSPLLRPVTCDPGSWEQAEALVLETINAYGGIDAVVSCAGVFDQGTPLVEIPGALIDDALTQCLRANVTSALHVVRAALGTLAERRGRIVLTSSFASTSSSGGGVLYTASKHALAGVVKQLAYEFAPHVRVNAVAPGVAATVMTGLSTLGQGKADAVLEGTESVLPLGDVPATDDYASVYSLLADPVASAAMTGTTITVDSGLAVRGLGAPSGRTLSSLVEDSP